MVLEKWKYSKAYEFWLLSVNMIKFFCLEAGFLKEVKVHAHQKCFRGYCDKEMIGHARQSWQDQKWGLSNILRMKCDFRLQQEN